MFRPEADPLPTVETNKVHVYIRVHQLTLAASGIRRSDVAPASPCVSFAMLSAGKSRKKKKRKKKSADINLCTYFSFFEKPRQKRRRVNGANPGRMKVSPTVRRGFSWFPAFDTATAALLAVVWRMPARSASPRTHTHTHTHRSTQYLKLAKTGSQRMPGRSIGAVKKAGAQCSVRSARCSEYLDVHRAAFVAESSRRYLTSLMTAVPERPVFAGAPTFRRSNGGRRPSFVLRRWSQRRGSARDFSRALFAAVETTPPSVALGFEAAATP